MAHKICPRVLAKPQVRWLAWMCCWSLPDHAAVLSPCLLCSTVIVFYVQSGPPFKVLKAADVVQNLHRQLAKEKADFLLFKVLRIDTAGIFPVGMSFLLGSKSYKSLLSIQNWLALSKTSHQIKCIENLTET